MGSLLRIPHHPKPTSSIFSPYSTNHRFPDFVSSSSILNPPFSSLPRFTMPFPSTPFSKSTSSLQTHLIRNRLSTKPTSISAIKASSGESPADSSKNKTNSIILCSVVTAILGVSNRVLYKLALVPLKEYPFFLAQFITFGYVAIYFSMLFIRHRAGIVTDEMIAIPKWRFVLIGFLEALGVAAGMASAAILPGPSIPILNQKSSETPHFITPHPLVSWLDQFFSGDTKKKNNGVFSF